MSYPIFTAPAGGSGGEEYTWVRPADWIALPDHGTNTQYVKGIVAVRNNKIGGVVAFNMSGTGTFDIDWGDGTTTTGASFYTDIEHIYDWDDLDSGTETSEGWRQAAVLITPSSPSDVINRFESKVPSTTYSLASTTYGGDWVEMELKGSWLISPGLAKTGSLRHVVYYMNTEDLTAAFENCINLEYLELKNVSTNPINCNSMCYQCRGLRRIDADSPLVVNYAENMFSSCHSLEVFPPLDISTCTYFGNAFAGCYSMKETPLLQFTESSETRTYVRMFQGCYALKKINCIGTMGAGTGTTLFSEAFENCQSLSEVPPLNIAGAAIIGEMFFYCYSLKHVELSLSGVTANNFWGDMFERCEGLQSIVVDDLSKSTGSRDFCENCTSLRSFVATTAGFSSACTIITDEFNFCHALQELRLPGQAATLELLNTGLSRDALVDLFNDLATVSGKSIIITGTVGASALSQADRDIAINKGWTIVG